MVMEHKFAWAPIALTAFLHVCAGSGNAQTPSILLNQSSSSAGSARSTNPPASANAGRSQALIAVPPDFASLKLAPGFLVNLSVLDDPDFDGDFRVDQAGDLALPVLGTIHVSGETASEARTQIQSRLQSDQILKSPQVNLTVVEYAALEVTILGEVPAPGRYALLAPRNLTDVLALAGGLSVSAGNEIQITHSGNNQEPEVIRFSKATRFKTVQDTIIHPGDTIQVKRAGIVYVLGAVNRPGGYVMQEDGTLSVLQAISLANGTMIPASLGTIYLLRRNSDGSAVKMELSLRKMQRGKSADMQLQAADVLYIPMSKVKSALINSQGILAAATSASIYAATVY